MTGQITTPKVKGIADIVFLIDATASMQPCIDAVKRNVAAFVKPMTTPDANGGSVVKDWRAKIVGYRDIRYDSEPFIDNPFVSNTQELETQLSNLRANGGGDEPESLLEALYKLAAQPVSAQGIRPDAWRPTAAARRFVVVFTDAGFHEPLDEPAGATIDDVIMNLMTAKIVLHIFAPKRCDRYNTLAEVDKAMYHAVGDEGLSRYTSDTARFAKILETLAKTITVEAVAIPLLVSVEESDPFL